MRILGISNPESGCGYHRVVNPLAFMEGTRYITNNPTSEIMEQGWDIILFNRTSPFDDYWQTAKNITGAKVVMDMDDDWVLPPGHVNYYEYAALQPRIEENLRSADLVTCTHERLAARCREFNDNVVIVPNALPFGKGQYNEERLPSESLRLFWAGGISHINDIELLRNPMKRIKNIPGISCTIGGYNSGNVFSRVQWDKMVSAFTCGLQIPGSVLHSLPVDQYMNHFIHGDVMLLPLEESRWHSMKSNLKLLEAGAKRMPVIVSKVDPYIDYDPPVFYVERQGDWFEYVNHFSRNRDAVNLWGDKLHEWAKQFDLLKVNEIRKECYSQLLTLLTGSIPDGNFTKSAVS